LAKGFEGKKENIA